jgi:hypothetical protein
MSKPENSKLASYLRKVVLRLGIDGQSSDEESMQSMEGMTGSFLLAKKAPWRAKDITTYMQLLDKLRGELDAAAGLSQQGMSRLRNYMSESQNPAPRLPKTFYDATWLELKSGDAPGWVANHLQVAEDDFPMLQFDTGVLQ